MNELEKKLQALSDSIAKISNTPEKLSDYKITTTSDTIMQPSTPGQIWTAHQHTIDPDPSINSGVVGTWQPASGWPINDTRDSKFMEAVKSSLNDNIDQNKGNLKMTRSFMEAVIEAAILKTDIKFDKNKNINEIVAATCDRLISVDSPEVNVPACMVNINELSERIYTEVCTHKEQADTTGYVSVGVPSSPMKFMSTYGIKIHHSALITNVED
jgi:hypothetical protein